MCEKYYIFSHYLTLLLFYFASFYPAFKDKLLPLVVFFFFQILIFISIWNCYQDVTLSSRINGSYERPKTVSFLGTMYLHT